MWKLSRMSRIFLGGYNGLSGYHFPLMSFASTAPLSQLPDWPIPHRAFHWHHVSALAGHERIQQNAGNLLLAEAT